MISSSGGKVSTTTSAVSASGAVTDPSGPPPSPVDESVYVTVKTVTYVPRPDGGVELVARGTASAIAPDDAIYAVAQPPTAAASGVTRGQEAGPSTWFVSSASKPDSEGRWHARIQLRSAQSLTVSAVVAPTVMAACAYCSPVPTTPSEPPDHLTRLSLQQAGPASEYVRVRSRRITASAP